MKNPRFILIENDPIEFPNDGLTCWYWDTHRPAKSENDRLPYVAVESYCNKNPNDYALIEGRMMLLFTDQAEYYAVCEECYYTYKSMQWSGSTSSHNWRSKSAAYLKRHQHTKGWCEFCDPIFGNGGWLIR